MKLYDNGHSGNAYKVRLMLAHLGVPFERIALDIDNGETRTLVESKREPGYKALGVMEGHLAGRSFFVAEQFTIADIALYVYTHVADEGGGSISGTFRLFADGSRGSPASPVTF